MNSQIGYGNQFHLSKNADRKNKITVYGKLIDIWMIYGYLIIKSK